MLMSAEINKYKSKSTRYFTAHHDVQYLQLQPGRGLSSYSIHPCASQLFSTIGSEPSRGKTDEILQVLQRKCDEKNLAGSTTVMTLQQPNQWLKLTFKNFSLGGKMPRHRDSRIQPRK